MSAVVCALAAPRRRGAPLTPEVREAVRAALMADRRASWTSIARRYGTSTRTVARHARALGQGVRPRVPPSATNLADSIRLRLREGWRPSEVARWYGCSQTYVGRVAARARAVKS